MLRAWTVAAAGVLLLSQDAAAEELRLRWSELAPVVTDRKIQATLDGVRIEGRALAVEPGGLRLKITRTGDRRAWPKDETTIPRARLAAFTVTRYRVRWRPILALGMPMAIAIATWQAAPSAAEGAVIYIVAGIGAAAVVGTAIGGYFIGRRLDRRTVAVTVMPE